MSRIEDSLQRLADTAWAARKIPPDLSFVLLSERLPSPAGPNAMRGFVEKLYEHARKWAPGFEIPYSIPKVSVSRQIESAGQYRASSSGDLFIDVSQNFAMAPDATLAILAHEGMSPHSGPLRHSPADSGCRANH